MRNRNRLRWVVRLSAMLLAAGFGHASAQAPQLAYSPQPDQIGTEVNFNGAPTTQIAVTPSGGGGDASLPGNQSTLTCSLADEGGDDNINFSPGVLFFAGDTLDPQNFNLSCEPLDAQPSFATLSCNEKIGGINTGTKIWDIVCPAGGTPTPELVATPAPGPGLVMASNQPVDDTENITIQNVGNATLNVTSITGLGPPFSASPLNAAIAAAGQQIFTVTCDGVSEGSFFDQFTINSNDADEGALAYDASCTVSGAEFDGVPAPGTPIALQTVQAQNVSTQIGVFNSGNAALNITGLTLTDPSGKLSASIDDGTIDGGANAIITIACNAGAIGSSGLRTLTFNTTDMDGAEAAISYPNISCDVTMPSLVEFDPSLAPPGPANLAGTTVQAATPVVVTIVNSGTAVLNITNQSAFTPPLTYLFSNTTVPANGGSVTLTFSCSSVSVTTDNETLTFNTNDGDDNEGLVTYNVSCSITSGAAPEFASIPPANQGAPSTLTINTTQGTVGNKNLMLQNVGTATLTGIAVQTPPVNPPFNSVTVPSTLSAGASQAVGVSCVSDAVGTTPGTLVVQTGNDPDEPSNTYPVSCVVAEAAEFSSIPAAPGPISFVTNEDVIASTNVTLRNLGTTNLTISAINVTSSPDPFTFSTGALPLTIVPGATANATARCLSTTPGNYSGTATLSTDDPDDMETSVVFNLSCRVNLVAPEYSSTPGAGAIIQFYTSPNATPPPSFEPFTTTVRISNIGNATLTYSLSGLSGVFSSAPATPGSYTLAAGASTNIAVTCNGTNLSTAVQTLGIAHNDSNETPANYTFRCIPDIRRTALPMLRALIGSPLATDPGTFLFADGFE